MSSDPINILFACSEMTPWVKTGGLADVCGSLPQALRESGDNISIVLPGYHSVLKTIADQNSPAPEFLTLLELPLGTVTVCKSIHNGTQVLLVNHESFTNRPGNPYMSDPDRPWPDNARRFALFCQAVCKIALNQANLFFQATVKPDIVHCHDWQTGLVPALLSLEADAPATVFTIHNLAYQGNISMDTYHELGLPEELLILDGLEFWGQASCIKGGLAYADQISTVSQRYAEEITTSAFGCGMEGLLQFRKDKLSGILNGIDTDTWDPSSDPHIAKPYTFDSIESKAENKSDLQKTLNLKQDPDAVLFGVISRLAVQKGIDLIVDTISQLAKPGGPNLQLAVLGSGDSELQASLLKLASAHPQKIAVEIGFNETLSHKIEAGADVFLMPSRYEPCGLNQMYSHRYGTLPLVTRVGGLADTVIDDEKALTNGFIIDAATPRALRLGIERAIELFDDKTSWNNMVKNAMQANYSWAESASKYQSMYRELLEARATQTP